MVIDPDMTNLLKKRSCVKSIHRFIMKVCLFCCAVVMLSSCAGNQDNTGKNPEVRRLNCLIVLPAAPSAAQEKKMDAEEIKSLRKGAAFVDGVLAEQLNNFPGARLLTAAQVEGFGPEISGNRIGLLKMIGRELKCDVVLLSSISRFHQREGGEFAADFPASAAFTMELVRIDDGRVIWKGSFDETQESLLSNLLSFGKAQDRGFKWVTVEELVRQGVKDRLSACPYLE
jgi:hypothetical protein